MIKIKDHIFNENKIIQIDINERNNLEIDVDNGFPIVVKNATFEDIQWEYDRFRVEADKDGVIFANRILEKEIKEDKPKEDKKIKKLDLTFEDKFIKENLESGGVYYLDTYTTLKMIYNKLNEIIDKMNGEE